MSERGAEFLLGWADGNIEPSADRPSDETTRAKLAECLAAAEAAGIPRAEMEAEVGPLEEYLRVIMSTPSEVAAVRLEPEGELTARTLH